MRIDAETGDKAVHHELHVSILAACPPPEGFGWVEQQSLVGQGGSVDSTFLVRYTVPKNSHNIPTINNNLWSCIYTLYT